MQTHSHAEDSCGCSGHHEHSHDTKGTGIFLYVGTVFLLASGLCLWFQPDNKILKDVLGAIAGITLCIPIVKTAVEDLLRGHMHMDELVALAVLAAMVQGDFLTAGVVAFFMLISQVIESRTAHGAHAAIESLVKLSPSKAVRVSAEGLEEEVDALGLVAGDLIRVRPGEAVPADGRVVKGLTTLNEATITGESLPLDKGEGADVFAGTQNLTGVIDVEVFKVGEDTTLGKVKELILAAEQTKLPFTKLVDRYAGYYTPVILMLALLVWFFTGEWSRLVAVLVIACPCAFILATPTAMVAALSSAARHGILFKNVVDLEAASRITSVVFDKTGTLTTGQLGVVRLAPSEGVDAADLLSVAAHAEQHSRHPVAKAIVALAQSHQVELQEVEAFHEEAGQGVKAKLGSASLACGRALWLGEQGLELPSLDEGEMQGLSTVWVTRDGQFLGWIGLRDELREEARGALSALSDLGIQHMAMVTGDRGSVAERVALELGGIDIAAECLPDEKATYVSTIKKQGYRVAFVGDGVNDAPALASCDTGIAMGAAGSDVAIHSATVALMSNDLSRLPYMVRLSRRARQAVYENLAIGFFFIVGGLIFSGMGYLNPAVAAFLHNAGSLIVVFNSARLVRFGEEEGAHPDDEVSLLEKLED